MQLFHNNWGSIAAYHQRIWPGFAMDRVQSKFAKRKCGETDADEQQHWLKEHTISTSEFVSLIVNNINFKYRNVPDRAHACAAFKEVILLLATTLGGFDLEIIPCGSQDNQVVTMNVDKFGKVDSSCFWTQEFFARHVRGPWKRDYLQQNKTWIESESCVGRCSFAELVCFSLDPQHPEFLMGKLLPEILTIMSEIGRLLDDSLPVLRRDVATLDYDSTFNKNMRRTSTSVKTLWVERVARTMWSHEESQPTNFLWHIEGFIVAMVFNTLISVFYVICHIVLL